MRLLRLTMALLIAGILAGAFVPLTSAAGVDIYLEPIDSVSGVSITDACFVLQNYSNEGCDENGDGQISFAAVPPGQYTIVQTQSAAGYADTAPLTITVGDRKSVV